jgi:hypothetical protein
LDYLEKDILEFKSYFCQKEKLPPNFELKKASRLYQRCIIEFEWLACIHDFKPLA